MMRAEEKISRARKVKEALSPMFKVRRGKAYIYCQCKKCQKVFQVPYKRMPCLFALAAIEFHIKKDCVFRNCGKQTT